MPNLLPHWLRRGRTQQLHGPLPFCCCQRFPGPRKKGQAKPEGCYPNRPAGGTRRGPGNHTTAVEKACSLQITRTVGHPRPSSFSMKNKKKSRSPKAFSFPRRISLPSSSLSFNGWGKHSLIWTWRAFFPALFIQSRGGVGLNIG